MNLLGRWVRCPAWIGLPLSLLHSGETRTPHVRGQRISLAVQHNHCWVVEEWFWWYWWVVWWPNRTFSRGLYPRSSNNPQQIPIGSELPYSWDQASNQSLSLHVATLLAITHLQPATLTHPTPAHQYPCTAHLRIPSWLVAPHHGLSLPWCYPFYELMNLSRLLMPLWQRHLIFLDHLFLGWSSLSLIHSLARCVSNIALRPGTLLRQIFSED